MTKIDALRRFLLPCFAPSSAATSAATAGVPKKRLSTSLRDDIQDDVVVSDVKQQERHQEVGGRRRRRRTDNEVAASSQSDDSVRSVKSHAPPRSSKSMVIGTIFGRRRGHVWFSVQHDRLSTKPALLLELSMPVSLLVKEMQCGLVRLALECDHRHNNDRSEHRSCPLRSVPVWTVYCNGRKVGFAARRKPTAHNRLLLKTMQSISVGAGVIPAGFGSAEAGGGEGEDEVMYMRANFECVVGSADSESFHLINPGECPGQEISVFLLRTR